MIAGFRNRLWATALVVSAPAAIFLTSCQATGGGENVMSQSAVKMWATGDGVRVNPETGRYLEERTDIHADYPSGDYQARNAVWEAAENRVALRSARNEFVAFQLVVESDKPLRGVEVSFERLQGPGGVEISGRGVALLKAWYVQVVRPSSGYEESSLGLGWYPDALIPAEVGAPLVFDLPDAENGIGETQRNQTVWVDIYVPRDREEAPPGKYTGVVRVSWPGGQQEVPVELTVWDFALPDEIHCRGDIFNNSIKNLPPEIEMLYYQMCIQHRFQPGVCFYRPELKIEGTQVSLDWEDYDQRVGPYLDGSAFTDKHGYWGPGYGLPIDHILMPFDCERGESRERAWPAATPEGGPTPEFEAIWLETERQVKEHFEADPNWRKVEKIIFLDGLDEAYNEEAYKKMAYFGGLLQRGLGKGWFKYRIDGGYSWEAMDFLHPYVNLWVCHSVGFDAKKMAHFREKGVEPWFYGPMIYERRANSGCGSNTFIDLDLLTCRGIGWAAWKHKCGYCEWEFDWNADIAWRTAANYDRGRVAYNGSGQFIYRGEPIGRVGPVPSIRLKAHRRGFQDYEYFWLLQQAGKSDAADEVVDGIVHTPPFGQESVGNTEIWRNNPEEWDAARIRAGELLAATAGK